MRRNIGSLSTRPRLRFEDLIDESYLAPPVETAAVKTAWLPDNLVGLWESQALQPSQIDTYVPLGIR